MYVKYPHVSEFGATEPQMTIETLILGIGNTLLRDEGVGVHTVEFMRTSYPDSNIEYVDGGTLSFTLAEYIELAGRLIVVDAADFGGRAGECRRFIGEDMDRFLAGGGRSVHEVSLNDVLDISRLRERLPQQRALFGIQPETVDWGGQPSPAVAAAVGTTAERIWQLVQHWR